PVYVQLLSSFLKLYYFGSLVIRGLVERILLGVHHLLDAVVVRIEISAGDRPVFISSLVNILFDKPVLLFTEQDICINQRASTKSTRNNRIDALKRPYIEHSVQAFAGIPEISLHPVRTARK